jgi:GTPase
MTDETPYRCGFVAVIGRPNVGKSTLINAIIGNKVSIVTPKPQTTRHRIVAAHTRANAQILFVDTPGLHLRASKAMNRMMNRAAASALTDADLVLFLCEANRWTAEDDNALQKVRDAGVPVIAVLNKMDKVHPQELLLETMAEMSQRAAFLEVVPLSAKSGANLDRLLELIPRYLPESGPLYPEDMQTDRGDLFRYAELIREKLTLSLRQEVPYGLTVQIERLVEEPEGIAMHAVIWVERDSQKGIVVGKQGRHLKNVGRDARLELRAMLGVPVHLELWVKVKSNWADSDEELQRLGYELQ